MVVIAGPSDYWNKNLTAVVYCTRIFNYVAPIVFREILVGANFDEFTHLVNLANLMLISIKQSILVEETLANFWLPTECNNFTTH